MIAAAHIDGTTVYIHLDSGIPMSIEEMEAIETILPEGEDHPEDLLPARARTSAYAQFGWGRECRKDARRGSKNASRVPRDKGHEKNHRRMK
jgi:hypothetical protein